MPKEKQNSKKNIRSILFVAILTVVVIAVFAYLIINGGNIFPQKNQKAVAIVNGETITEAQLEAAYNQLPQQYKAFMSKDDILEQLIDKKIVLQEAKKKGIIVSDSEIEEQIASIESQFPSEEDFLKLLQQQNLTLKEIKDQLREQLIINKLLNVTVLYNLTVSDKEISDYYDENQAEFTAQTGQIRAAHILVDTEQKAEDIINNLNNGVDFGQLAVQASIDPSAKTNKGDLGFFAKGDMVKEFEDAAFSLKVGEISKPVKTEYGYHVIKRLPNRISLDETKETISATLLKAKQTDAIGAYLDELRNNSVIKKGAELEQPAQITQKNETDAVKRNEFVDNGREICKENGNAIIRAYTASNCEKCKETLEVLNSVLADYNFSVYEWELDTGDNLYTTQKEGSISKPEFDVLKQYNSKGAVPAYVFGCRYVRIGNAFSQTNVIEEETAFREVLQKI